MLFTWTWNLKRSLLPALQLNCIYSVREVHGKTLSICSQHRCATTNGLHSLSKVDSWFMIFMIHLLNREDCQKINQASVKPTVSIWLAETWRSAARKAKATSSRPASSPVQYLQSTHCNWTWVVLTRTNKKEREESHFILRTEDANYIYCRSMHQSCKRCSGPWNCFSSPVIDPGPISAKTTCLGARLWASTKNCISFSAVTRPT